MTGAPPSAALSPSHQSEHSLRHWPDLARAAHADDNTTSSRAARARDTSRRGTRDGRVSRPGARVDQVVRLRTAAVSRTGRSVPAPREADAMPRRQASRSRRGLGSGAAGAGPTASASRAPWRLMRSASVVRLMLSSSAARDLLPDAARSAHAIRLASRSASRSSSEMLVTGPPAGGTAVREAGALFRVEQDLWRDAPRVDRPARAGLGDSLARVLQLAHVAGPRVAEERLLDVRWHARRGQSPPAEGALEEVVQQHRDVLTMLAERRQSERDHAETMEQVLAEAPLRHHQGEIAACSRR